MKNVIGFEKLVITLKFGKSQRQEAGPEREHAELQSGALMEAESFQKERSGAVRTGVGPTQSITPTPPPAHSAGTEGQCRCQLISRPERQVPPLRQKPAKEASRWNPEEHGGAFVDRNGTAVRGRPWDVRAHWAGRQ